MTGILRRDAAAVTDYWVDDILARGIPMSSDKWPRERKLESDGWRDHSVKPYSCRLCQYIFSGVQRKLPRQILLISTALAKIWVPLKRFMQKGGLYYVFTCKPLEEIHMSR